MAIHHAFFVFLFAQLPGEDERLLYSDGRTTEGALSKDTRIQCHRFTKEMERPEF